MVKQAVMTALVASIGLATPAGAQTVDPAMGRRLAETVCSTCHQIDAGSSTSKQTAPSFVQISRMPSMTELAIKVFLRSSHPHMPDIILSSEEINSVAAYIRSLANAH